MLGRRKVNMQKYVLTVGYRLGEVIGAHVAIRATAWLGFRVLSLLALAPARLSLCVTANDQEWGSVMSKEFDSLKSLLDLSEPSERDPQVDRDEAAKLAARWGWLVRQDREQRGECCHARRPSSKSAFFG